MNYMYIEQENYLQRNNCWVKTAWGELYPVKRENNFNNDSLGGKLLSEDIFLTFIITLQIPTPTPGKKLSLLLLITTYHTTSVGKLHWVRRSQQTGKLSK